MTVEKYQWSDEWIIVADSGKSGGVAVQFEKLAPRDPGGASHPWPFYLRPADFFPEPELTAVDGGEFIMAKKPILEHNPRSLLQFFLGSHLTREEFDKMIGVPDAGEGIEDGQRPSAEAGGSGRLFEGRQE